MLKFLSQSTWVDQIGWMLVHSLWQFALVAALAVLLQWALQRCTAVTRYWALLAAMCVVVVLPVVTWFSLRSADTSSAVVVQHSTELSETALLSPNYASMSLKRQNTAAPTVPEFAQSRVEPRVVPIQAVQSAKRATIAAIPPFSLMHRRIQTWLPAIVLIWFVGVLVAALRPLLSWYTVGRLKTVGVSPVGEAVQILVERAATRLRVTKVVEVLQSTLVQAPAAVGYFRPVILLPLCMLTGLPEPQLELILAHELAHIRRHDYLLNLLQTLVETLFFYHPGVWWLSRQIRNEREHCCDDMAMATMGNRADYGRALLAVEQLRAGATALSLSAGGGSLVNRIRRIAGCEPAPRIAGGASIWCFLLISLAVFVGVIRGTMPATAKPEQQQGVAANKAAQRAENSAANGAPVTETPVAEAATEQTGEAPAKGAWKAGQTLDVQVIDAKTKEPLPGVRLVFQYHGPGIDFQDVKTMTTDAAGRSQARLPDARPDAVRIYPAKSGYVPLRVYWGDDLPAPKLPKAVTIRMQPGTVWGGIVQNEQGEPIKDVKITVRYWETRAEYNPHLRANIDDDVEAVTTDEQGRWRMDILPARFTGDGPRLFLTHPSYVSDHLQRSHTPLPITERPSYESLQSETAVMVMRKGGVIKGRVVDDAGRPIAGAQVRNQERHWGGSDKPAATTAADGTFQITKVFFTQSGINDPPPETMRALQKHQVALVVQADGYAPELIHAAPDGSTSPLEITLKPGKAVVGRVTDEGGKPLEGVSVSVSNWLGYRSRLVLSTKTAADGKFRLPDAPPSGALYNFYKKGYMTLQDFRMLPEQTSEPGDAGYDIKLKAPLRVSGAIIDAETKQPLTECTVTKGVEYDDGRETEWQVGYGSQRVTNGRYEVEFADGIFFWRIRVEAAGYKPVVSRIFRPYNPDRGLVTLDFEMKKAAPLPKTALRPMSGTVLGLDGQPLTGAEVFLAKQQFVVENRMARANSQSSTQMVKTDAQGHFEFPREDKPFYLVVLHEQGHIVLDEQQFAKTPTVRITPWLPAQRGFMLQRKQSSYRGSSPDNERQTLNVRIVDAQGNPVENARVASSMQFYASYNFLGDNEAAWQYTPHLVLADQDGRARIANQDGLNCIVARHAERKLVAIQRISPEQAASSETVTITLQPQCKVFGRLTAKELEARNKRIEWSNVFVYLKNRAARPMSCTPDETGFHFYLPPGTYELDGYANDTEHARKTITVKPGQQELAIEPIDLPPSQLVLLEGKPAPELRDVVAWKNGGPVKLSDLKGKVVVLAFSLRWVADRPHDWMPNLFTIYDKYSDQGLAIVHIRVGFGIDSQEKLDAKLAEVKSPFWEDRDLKIPIALGLPNGPAFLRTAAEKQANENVRWSVLKEYGINGMPRGVLIDRQGRIVGEFDLRSEKDNGVLEKLLKEN